MKLLIINHGDYSVGESGFYAEIEVKTRDSDVFSREFIERLKEYVKSELEAYNGLTEVLTEEEYKQYVEMGEVKNDQALQRWQKKKKQSFTIRVKLP